MAELIAAFPGVEDQLISRHLGIPRRGALVEDRKHGRSRIYELTGLGRDVARLIGRLPLA